MGKIEMKVRNPLAAERPRYKYERLDGADDADTIREHFLRRRKFIIMALSLAAIAALLVAG